jgi:hypothetical protein
MAERKPTYGELLMRPEWYAKRSRIIELARFECVECGDHLEEHQFEVHHRYYLRGRKPWEYPDKALMCVCGPCHANLGMLDDELRYTIGQLTTQQIEQVRVFARRLLSADHDPVALDRLYEEFYRDSGPRLAPDEPRGKRGRDG